MIRLHLTHIERMNTARNLPLFSLAMIACLFCAGLRASTIEDSQADRVSPTHESIAYGTGQEVLDLYLARSKTPTPVYIWGHARGMTYKMVPRNMVRQSLRLGISFVSIEANDMDEVTGRELRLPAPWNKALNYVKANAERYNIDPNNIFLGGRSLGSIGSFPVAMRRWSEIRGIYSMQALPKVGKLNVPYVHKNSPPCFLVYKTARGSKNHDPLHGTMIGEAYEHFGIGDRFSIRTEVKPSHWFNWFFDFVEDHILEPGIDDLDPARFANAIKAFEKEDREYPADKGGTVIVGSSSVRRLDADAVFPGVPLIQRGFGGAHISDVNHYLERIVLKHEPSKVIFFCGGNDLWRGHSIAELREDFQQFSERLFHRVPNCKLYVLAIRPSPKRNTIIGRVLRMNRMLERLAEEDPRITLLRASCDEFLDDQGEPITSLYVEDNQHMNEKGYQIWTEILMPHLTQGENEL